jgi:hypothetical protein
MLVSLMLPRRKTARDLSTRSASTATNKGETCRRDSPGALAAGENESWARFVAVGNRNSANVSLEYRSDLSTVFRIAHSSSCCPERFITVWLSSKFSFTSLHSCRKLAAASTFKHIASTLTRMHHSHRSQNSSMHSSSTRGEAIRAMFWSLKPRTQHRRTVKMEVGIRISLSARPRDCDDCDAIKYACVAFVRLNHSSARSTCMSGM